MSECSKYKFCNYCKHFKLNADIPKFPAGTGICKRKEIERTFPASVDFWTPACSCFEYTIHNWYGVDVVEFLKEYKDTVHILLQTKRINIKDYIGIPATTVLSYITQQRKNHGFSGW